jgi:acyl carrier protein
MDARGAVLASLGAVAPDADLASLAPEVELREVLGLDSLDFVRFVTGLAERTGLTITARDYPRLQTLAACSAYVDERRAG